MVKTIVLLLIAVLLYGYSFLRYRYLWSRGKVPMLCYYVFQVFLLGTLFVCSFFAYWLSNDFLLLGIQLICDIYLSIMLLTPFFSLIRGAVRMPGKRFGWNNRLFRFFNHPTKISKIVFVALVLFGTGLFVYSKIPICSEKTVTVEKEANVESIRVVSLSDLEIGNGISRYEVKKIFDELKKIQPDYVILLGNFFSYPVQESLRKYTYGQLKEIASFVPIYLIEGSKEIKGDEMYIKEVEKIGVKVLQDEMLQLSEGIQFVGCRYIKNPKRNEFSFTCSLLNKKKPAIVFSYEDLSPQEKQSADYDVLFHAPFQGGAWLAPKKIQQTQINFMPKGKALPQ